MKKKLILGLLIGLSIFQCSVINTTFANTNPDTSKQSSTGNITKNDCKGIKLNTNVPFIGNCISNTSNGVNQLNAFPRLMRAMMNLVLVVILVVSLLIIVASGVLITTGGAEQGNYSKGMGMIKKVAMGIALLGASGVILKLINPNFFV